VSQSLQGRMLHLVGEKATADTTIRGFHATFVQDVLL